LKFCRDACADTILLRASNSGLKDGDMAEIDHRDFFISFNSADLAYAEAIDAALRAAGFTTHFHPRDLQAGGNIPQWMDEALMNSGQTLALYSPDYISDKAIYSRAEHYASWWQEPDGDARKLIPIILRETTITPLIAMISRIEVLGMTPTDAATRVIERLKTPEETSRRDHWRVGLPVPKVFNAAYRPNPNFTGRFEALDSLQLSLRQGTNAAITAVAGMGGIGKTTLAAEYCHRFGGRYSGVWWVRAEQESVMLADLQALGQRLGVVSGKNIEVDARACLDHLASLTQPWLMVYDNAPNPDAVRKWLPTGAVRCIITSRFVEFGAIAPVTRLDQWSDEVTADYLLSRTRRHDIRGAARLAHAIGGLPLAAEQAATYLSLRDGISFDEYTADIPRLIKQRRTLGSTGEYPDTIYAALVRSLETLHNLESGEVALDILRLCAFLSPDGIDLGLVGVGWGSEILPATLATTTDHNTAREDALAALASLSLLRREDGPVGAVLIFHRLLLEVVRDWIGEDAREVWSSAAIRLVRAVFPEDAYDDPSQWPVCAGLMPHIAPLDASAPHTGAAGKGLDDLLNRALGYLMARGDRESALMLAERSVALKRRTRADEPLGLATGLINLAGQYAELDRLNDAEKACLEALEIVEPRLDRNHPYIAMTLANLAGVYLKRNDFAAAEPLLLRTEDIMKIVHGAESWEYGTQLSNLGALYGEWAREPNQSTRREQEHKYKNQALAVLRAARGERHPHTAVLHYNLATMKESMGDHVDAAKEMERSVAIMLSLGLAKHPDTARRTGALAAYWGRSGQADKAARLQRGDIADLLPVIAAIEAEHRAWVAKDPQNRHFGPHSPFERSEDDTAKIARALAEAGIDINDLIRRIQSGELSEEDGLKIVGEKLEGRSA
jgi:tetratricopeptide (TPR) repeat protein